MAKINAVSNFVNSAKDRAEGIHAVTIVEIETGMTLAGWTDGTIDPDIASAYNVEVVKSKLKAIEALGLKDKIDDILITLSSQFHLINVTAKGTHMVYLAADRKKANLAILRNLLKKGINEISSGL